MKACTCSSHCLLSGYHDAGCCAEISCDCWCHQPAGEHRGSRPGVDPTFSDAAFKEKSERIWAIANGVGRAS